MSKYRIKVKPYLYKSGELGDWYYVQKKMFGLFWYTLDEFTTEFLASRCVNNRIELEKSKVKIIEVIEEK